jgi:alkanesulfonate monooxygenase SsuD/methylene tetrahydromethanopterin reductase-like flavin-dependent oxidoreductase (luciferase family)
VQERHFDAATGFANAFAIAAALSSHLSDAYLAVQPAVGLDHPLRVVEQANMLDLLTRGRCLLVLSDDADAEQYAAFGLPTPRNGLLEDLVERITDGWMWQYREDGPPLSFQSGPYSAQMAGRVMPTAFRQPHPLVARETSTDGTAADAARRGWPLLLRDVDAEDAESLFSSYRTALASAGHSRSIIDACLRRTVVRTPVTQSSDIAALAREYEIAGAAELRLDLAPDISLGDVLRNLVRSA